MITERLMGVGEWSLALVEEAPKHLVDDLRVARSGYSHIVVTPSHIQVGDIPDSDLLAAARYTGVYLKMSADRVMSGAGLATWLGDDGGRGDVLTSPVTQNTFSGWIGALRPSYFTLGQVDAIAGVLSKTYQRVTRRQALDEVCAFFGAEWRLRPNFTMDAGAAGSLFRVDPVAVIVRRKEDSGADSIMTGLVGDLEADEDAQSWARSVLYYFDNNAQVHEMNGGIADVDVPFRSPTGGPAPIRKVIESSTGATGEAVGLAAAEYAAVRETRREVRLNLGDYDVEDELTVGDYVYVHDPAKGFYDTATQVAFRGETIFPMKIRCVGQTWPVTRGMGVYLRRWIYRGTWALEWIDLTDYVDWESGGGSVEVGASPQPATSSASAGSAVSRDEYATTLAKLAGTGVSDWDQAVVPGFYWSDASAANRPSGVGWAVGIVKVFNGIVPARIVQEVSDPSTTASQMTRTWRRVFNNTSGTWGSWVEVFPVATVPLTVGNASPLYSPSATREGQFVQVDGAIASLTTANAWLVIANLPVGHRPAKYQYYPAQLPAASYSPTGLRVQLNGNIEAYGPITTAAMPLTGIRFVAAA